MATAAPLVRFTDAVPVTAAIKGAKPALLCSLSASRFFDGGRTADGGDGIGPCTTEDKVEEDDDRSLALLLREEHEKVAEVDEEMYTSPLPARTVASLPVDVPCSAPSLSSLVPRPLFVSLRLERMHSAESWVWRGCWSAEASLGVGGVPLSLFSADAGRSSGCLA